MFIKSICFPTSIISPLSKTTILFGRPNIEDLIRSGLVQLIINTPIGSQALHDDAYLRRAALEYNIPTFTTIPGANAAIKAIKALECNKIDAYSLQEIHN